MRNTIKLFMCAMLAFAFVGCTANETTEEARLTTPNFMLRAEGNSIIVTWDQVAGAAYYEVTLNPGSTEKTDKTIHKFNDLEYNATYAVSVKAVAADSSKSSLAETKEVTTPARIVPQYREFFPMNGSAATAISNNGRWIVGGNDRCGFVLDLTTDKMVEFPTAEFYDVADDGTAVGSDHSENGDGVAAILIGDKMVAIDLSKIASQHGMSCATGITPDANYIVGWFWDYDTSTYYAQTYGEVIPFCYDVLANRVSVPEPGNRIYNEAFATSIKSVTPDRKLLGSEQSQGIHSIIWEDEYTPFEYVYFQYDSNYAPVFSMGDTQNLFTQTGRYVYGKAIDYAAGQAAVAAAYDCENDTIMCFTGGSVTAMSDDGIAFLNDVPYYLGTTSYVIDTTKGEPYEWTELEEWLFDEHDVDVKSFEPALDTDPSDSLCLEGIITIGVSENGRVIMGITNTDMGWVTFVVDLDGAPME